MERMRGSSGVFGRFWATDFGSWTSTPWCRRGAVTMKMTWRTSMTSTSGVTLMSEKVFTSSSSLKATCRPALGEVALGQVHELELEVAHLGARRAHLPAAVVICDERGHHGDDRRRALLGNLRERHHDAHDGSKEADENRGRGRGREERQPAREAGRLDAGRALEGALDRGEALDEEAARVGGRHLAAVLDLLVQLGVARAENTDERARLALVADPEHVGELPALAEVVQERARVGCGA